MLKLISKSFFVSVLCGCLMLMDFSYKGAMLSAAQAESVKTEKINDSDLMGTLTMTTVGLLATRLYTYKMTTDIMLAAAGGAAFIGGEVLAFLKLKDVMKGMEVQITRDKSGNINKEQIESLERLKKSYEEAKKTANTKKMLQMASAAAFAAAGVMAFTMAGVETAQLTACTSTIPTVITAAAASAAACSVGGCSAPFIACVNSATALSSAITAYELKKQAIGPSGPALAAYTASNATLAAAVVTTSGVCAASGGEAIATACNTKLGTDVNQSAGGGGMVATAHLNPMIKKLLNENSELKKMYAANPVDTRNKLQKLLSQSMNFIMPEANAALFSAMGIASSAAVSFLLYTQKSLGPTIDNFMLIPQNRAIVWGILAGLTFAATSATNNVIKQIEANISKIDQILNSMYQMADGATATQLAGKTPAVQTTLRPNTQMQFSDTDYGEVDLSKENNGSLPCYTGEDTTKCKSFSDSLKETSAFSNLNVESQKQLQSIMSTANGVNGTSKISSATLKGAASLAGSANALRSAYDKAKKANAEALKKAGSKFNIDDQTNKISGLLEKNVKDSLKKSNTNASGMMSSMYGGKGSAGSSGSATASTAVETPKAPEAAIVPAGNVIDIGAGAGGEKNDLGITGVENGAEKEMTAEEIAKMNADQAALAGKTTMDDYDLKKDEISKDSTSSIFDLITNRYQKSGYPRLFKIKEQQTPAPVTK